MKQFALITLLLISTATYGNDAIEKLMIDNPTYKTTPPGIENSAAYFNIMNHSHKDIQLMGASSDVAKITEIHEHTMSNGTMKMQKVQSITIPAHSSIVFEPGGYHIMLIGVKQPIQTGDKASITLMFDNGKTKVVEVKATDHHKANHQHKHH